MLALSLTAPKQFQTIDLPDPGHPGLGDALVRVHRVGICGTDISAYLGKMPLLTYPRILGHELGVEVLEVGPGVTNVKPGDRCSVEPYINDPTSYASRRGRPNCCERLEVLGVHRDGGLRPRFILPARKLHVSTKLDYEQLALVETLAIGCHAVNRAAPMPDETCLIIGAGPIGLSVLEFVKLTGAKIIVLDLQQSRLDFCRNIMGIEHTLLPSLQQPSTVASTATERRAVATMDTAGSGVRGTATYKASDAIAAPGTTATSPLPLPRGEGRGEGAPGATANLPSSAPPGATAGLPSSALLDNLRQLTDNHLPDVVFDVTGSPKSMSQSFSLIAQGGRVVFVGLTGEEVSFRHSIFHKCEGTLLCSRNALPEDFPRIINLIETGRINTKPWITHRVPFNNLAEIFPSYTKPDSAPIKAIVNLT